MRRINQIGDGGRSSPTWISDDQASDGQKGKTWGNVDCAFLHPADPYLDLEPTEPGMA